MKKFYGKSFLLLLSCLLLAGVTRAQMFSTIAGSGANSFPFSTTSSNRVQNLYLPSMFPTATSGNITKIYIRTNGVTTAGTFSNLTVSMGLTSLTTFTTGSFVTGLTPVYFANAAACPVTAANGWYEIILTTPFSYNASSAFIVDISQTAFTGSGFTVQNSSVAGTRLYGPVTGTTGTAGAGCANFGFDVVPAGPCTSPPIAGTTTTSATTVCAGGTFVLNLTGNSQGTGQTYQWQSSPTATGTYTNVGTAAAFSAYTATATTSLYYRCAITCGTSTVFSPSVLVSVPALFPAGTYTINSALPNSATNFQTFGAAVSAISCGISGPVVFNVATGSGPYNEQVDIPNINTTSSNNTVTFNCNNVTLTAAGNASNLSTLQLSGADWIRVNNLNVEGTDATNALVCHLYNGANNNIFQGCTFTAPTNGTSSLQVPFSISGAVNSATTTGLGGDSNLVNNCTMNNGYYNTCIVGNSGTTAKYNRITNSKIRDFYFYGIYNYYAESSVLSGNDIERMTRTNSSSFYGVYLTTGSVNCLVEKNKVHDAFTGLTTATTSLAYVFYCLSAGTLNNENKIINNDIYNIKSNGTIYGIYTSSYSFYKIYHNTILLDDVAATAGTTYGIYIVGGTNMDVKNNIVYITRGGSGTKYCLNYSGTITSNYNDLYMNSSAGSNAIGYYSTAYATLALWKTANASAYDQNSVDLVPNFAGPSTGNLTPLNVSMNNLGTPVGVATDIIGANRSATVPDIGAHEFYDVAPICIANPINPANGSLTVCSGTTRLSWNASPPPVSYDVYFNTGTGAPTTIISPSQADTFLNVPTVVGSYSWKVIPKNIYGQPTGCGYWTFSTNPSTFTAVTTNVSPNDTVCVGDVPVFTATPVNGGTAPSYQWKKNGINVGTNSATYAAAGLNNGDYIKVVMTSNAPGCKTNPTPTSDSTRMVLQTVPPALIAAAGPVAFCSGGSVKLQTSTVGTSYQWIQLGLPIPGATNNYFDAQYSGYYRIKVNGVGTNICPAYSDSMLVTVYQSPFPLVNRQGMVLSTASTYATYQWYFNNAPIPGATSSTYTVTRDGRYVVKVTDTSGCNGASIVTPVNSLNVTGINASDVSIYPNPAQDVINISSPIKLNVAIRSIDGKLIMEAKNTTSINVNQLAEGIYIMYLSDDKQNLIKTEKIVKQVN